MIARFFLPAIALAAALLPAPALAWGKTGHRVVAAIADQHLSGLARANVQMLLGTESLDEAATWPDEMRSDPDTFWQKTSSPWHYVTVPGSAYDKAPPEGDAMTALNHFSTVLRDPSSSLADKQLALRFIVHLVGDLHQPLHVGRGGDRGGNEFKVNWFGKPSNLHSVWDFELVDQEQLSFTEFADRLGRRTTPQQVVQWWVADPRVWIGESAAIRETIYPAVGKTDLSWDYIYIATPIVERRLAQGGVRLAAYLNALFASAPAAGGGK